MNEPSNSDNDANSNVNTPDAKFVSWGKLLKGANKNEVLGILLEIWKKKFTGFTSAIRYLF